MTKPGHGERIERAARDFIEALDDARAFDPNARAFPLEAILAERKRLYEKAEAHYQVLKRWHHPPPRDYE